LNPDILAETGFRDSPLLSSALPDYATSAKK